MLTKKFYHADEAIAFPTISGIAIHDIRNDVFYNLDAGASVDIWNLLDGTNTGEEILTYLYGKYDGTIQQIREDLTDFLNQLLIADLIVEKDDNCSRIEI